MKITITATDKLTRIGGVPCRIWDGLTESGIPCLVLVHRVVVHKDHDQAEFQRQLLEQLPPGPHVELRQIL